jgi:hypothetical protein
VRPDDRNFLHLAAKRKQRHRLGCESSGEIDALARHFLDLDWLLADVGVLK